MQVAKALRAQGGLVVWVRVALGEILPRSTDIQLRDPNAPPPPAEASELIEELERQPGDVCDHEAAVGRLLWHRARTDAAAARGARRS